MTEQKQSRFRLHDADPKKLERWWQALNGDEITEQQYHVQSGGLAARARLRRAELPDDVLLTEAFALFLRQVPDRWKSDEHLYVSAMVAALFSHIKSQESSKHFITQLATGEKKDDSARMSELRFKQLLKSRTPEEFFHRMLQAIHLLKGKVHLLSLVDGVLRWYDEYLYGPDNNPMNRLSVRWAQNYYKESK
ncbi:type I-E CRISPR-associated protein Cse2/CasB [Oceanospirillum maris]|uniref:type I-E CRISPR-associated protein Cse2/CasB n=1 Tax=Oceanospirillum maris TaxID=64977 RepID=UPI00041B5B17|nr:type I-E CRISPR-associated protein Cse2/CasB [Oceanospirillum maris]